MLRQFIGKAMVLFVSLTQSQLLFAKIFELPIYEVAISPRDRIEANYKFDPHNQYIVCWETTGFEKQKLIWTFEHQIKEKFLPVVLKANEKIEGEWADTQGKLIVSNESDKNMMINCVYAVEGWER